LSIGASNSTYRVELVVSGRIAAILPWPSEASDFSALIAEKLLVNCETEMLGVVVDELLLEDDDVVLVFDLDELPHAATLTATTTASTAMAALLLSKCIGDLLPHAADHLTAGRSAQAWCFGDPTTVSSAP
jgi:hypothetical protein